MCGSVPQVPRLLFEDWTHEDFGSVLDSEDEVEELGKTIVQVAKVRPAALVFALTTDVPWGEACCPGLRLGQEGFPRVTASCPPGRAPALLVLQVPRVGVGGEACEGTRRVSTWPLCSWLLWGPPHCLLLRGASGPAVTSLHAYWWLAPRCLPTRPHQRHRTRIHLPCAFSEPAL